MDTRDGRIYTRDEVDRMDPIDRPYLKEMAQDPTPEQRAKRKVGRNDPCPCGSRAKFKRCCMWRLDPKTGVARV